MLVYVYRHAGTGRFVSKAYAEEHKDTTIKHAVSKPDKKQLADNAKVDDAQG